MNDSDGEHTDRERTIVGGRPLGETKPGAGIPRGVEMLLKMAAIDPTFCERLIHMRGQASKDLGYALSFSEAMILEAVPERQLRTMIEAMPVSDQERGVLEAANPLHQAPEPSPLLATMGIRPELYDLSGAPLRSQRVPTAPQTQDDWPSLNELIEKAALDPVFCRLLLARPPKAVREAGLRPTMSEVRFLIALPKTELQALVDARRVSEDEYQTLLEQTRRTMPPPPPSLYATRGIRPDD